MKALAIAMMLAFGQPAGSALRLPSMNEVPHGQIPPLSIPPADPEPDRRPAFVGAGIVAMAGLFWWNARRRARIDHEEDADDR
jgi:hypothetical protein